MLLYYWFDLINSSGHSLEAPFHRQYHEDLSRVSPCGLKSSPHVQATIGIHEVLECVLLKPIRNDFMDQECLHGYRSVWVWKKFQCAGTDKRQESVRSWLVWTPFRKLQSNSLRKARFIHKRWFLLITEVEVLLWHSFMQCSGEWSLLQFRIRSLIREVNYIDRFE